MIFFFCNFYFIYLFLFIFVLNLFIFVLLLISKRKSLGKFALKKRILLNFIYGLRKNYTDGHMRTLRLDCCQSVHLINSCSIWPRQCPSHPLLRLLRFLRLLLRLRYWTGRYGQTKNTSWTAAKNMEEASKQQRACFSCKMSSPWVQVRGLEVCIRTCRVLRPGGLHGKRRRNWGGYTCTQAI